MNQRNNYFLQLNKGLQHFLEQILDFSIQNSQRHCRFPKKNRRNAKIFIFNRKIYTQSIEIFTQQNVQFKGFTPIPDAFHLQRHQDFAWVKLSVHPHQTISPLSCTLKTFTSADAYRMWKYIGFSSSQMYSLIFYSTINVLTSRIFWMGSKIVSRRQELEEWHTYWNLPN